jgi:hypothetical protein
MPPRIRSLKPEHRSHRKVGPLSDRSYRLWVSLMCESDDEGRFIADVSQLRARTWPYHDVPLEAVEVALQDIVKRGSIRLYRIGKSRFGYFLSWRDHQHPKYPTPSAIPAPRFSHHSRKIGGIAGGTVGEDWVPRSVELSRVKSSRAKKRIDRRSPPPGVSESEFAKANFPTSDPSPNNPTPPAFTPLPGGQPTAEQTQRAYAAIQAHIVAHEPKKGLWPALVSTLQKAWIESVRAGHLDPELAWQLPHQ